MVNINETRGAPAASTLRKIAKAAGNSGGSSFADVLDAVSSAATQNAGGATPASGVNTANLLSLQEVGDQPTPQAREVARGEDMLQTLEKLRQSLLMGAIPPVVLRELEGRLATQRAGASDPGLIALIDDIELRVAVELAKLERAQAMAKGDMA